MSKLATQVITSFLLLILLGITIPMTSLHAYFHAHNGSDIEKHASGPVIKQGHTTCSLCEVQIPLMIQVESEFLTVSITSFDFLFSSYKHSELPVNQENIQLRGPPSRLF